MGFHLLSEPRIEPLHLRVDGKTVTQDIWPVKLPNDEKDPMEVTFRVRPSALFKQQEISLYADDCLQAVRVNGVPLDHPNLPHCDWAKSMTIDTGNLLRDEENILVATVRNKDGGGTFSASQVREGNLVKLLFENLYLLWILIWAVYCFRKCPQKQKFVVLLTAVAILLRVFYFLHTDFTERAYDVDGHLEYIEYVNQHWNIPQGDQGWEFHQQPLYYFFGAIVKTALHALDLDLLFLSTMQLFSLLMSIGTFFASVWIARMLFEKKTTVRAMLPWVALSAVLPGWIMLAPRINNDVPNLMFGVITVGFLIAWMKDPKWKNWLWMCVFLSCALLTKSSSIALIGVAGIALLSRLKADRTFFLACATGALTVGVVISGTFFVRNVLQKQVALVPVNVNPALHVRNFPGAYVTFNPVKILAHPFNNNWTDDERRQYLWEYFFKSAFFGEWQFNDFFGGSARILLALALLLMPFAFWGIWKEIRHPSRMGIMFGAMLFLFLLSLATFRLVHPNSSNQELRYISVVVLPMLFFLSQGIPSEKRLRPFGEFLIIGLSILCYLFIILVALSD